MIGLYTCQSIALAYGHINLIMSSMIEACVAMCAMYHTQWLVQQRLISTVTPLGEDCIGKQENCPLHQIVLYSEVTLQSE